MVRYDDPRASYLDDLVISEDDVLWASSSEAHRLASVAGSFDYVYDLYDNVVDISELWSTPQTSESFYLDNSWHKGASLSEFRKDINSKSNAVKQALMAAHPTKHESFRAVKDPSTRSVPKRKPKARSEASVQEKRDYAQQFKEAKVSESKSWHEYNDDQDFIDMRKEK